MPVTAVADVPTDSPTSVAVATTPVAITDRHTLDPVMPTVATVPSSTNAAVTCNTSCIPSIVTTQTAVTTAHLLALSNSSVAEDLEFSDSGNKVEDLDSALAHTSACGTTPGMSCAASTSVHSDGYCNKKYVVIRSFVANLSNRGPKYAKFLKTTSKYPDFFYKGPIEVVFVMLSPMSGDKKKKVQTLSEMLVDWVDSLKLKKKARGKKK
jgi:hypothetical protein